MKKKIPLFVLGAAVLVAATVAITLSLSGNKETTLIGENGVPLGEGMVWDSNAEEGGLVYRSQEEIQEELNRKVEEGMINISMNTSPVFPDGTSEGSLLIVNSERNNYPQVVTIVRKDTGEEIYRSGGIPVGSKIEYAKLSAPLAAGSYECVAYFNNIDPATGAVLGTAGAEIVITVQH